MIPGTEWPLLETYTGNLKLIQFLSEVPASKLAPRPDKVFEALKKVSPKDTKVIVIGQD